MRKHLVIPEIIHETLEDYSVMSYIPINKLTLKIFESSSYYKKMKKELGK